MPLTLSKMAANTATVTIHDGADSAEVDYHPSVITDETLMKLEALDAPGVSTLDQIEGLNAMLVELIASWEIYADQESEEQGIPLPLEPASLSKLPHTVKSDILWAIMGDARPEAGKPQKKRKK